jgi:hypothetical protein
LASHLEEGGRRAKVSMMIFSICQSMMRARNCKAVIIMRESPSIMKYVKSRDVANEAAKRAPCASP